MTPRPPTPDALLPPLRRLLQPLIRLLIASGVTFPVLENLLRTLYVDVARQGLGPDDPGASDSRISLRTGVHRKEIRRLRLEPPAPEFTAPPVVTRSSRIIAAWLGEPPWQDEAGAPRALPRLGPAPSFEALVASVTTDVRPRAVLDEWIDQGLVSLDADDRVRLDVAAFIPPPGQEAQLYYFARNLHDHIAAAAANVTANGTAGDAAPFLERAVHYDQLPESVAAAFEAAARAEGQAMLQRLNRVALDLLAQAVETQGPTRRVNLGVYVFTEADAP